MPSYRCRTTGHQHEPETSPHRMPVIYRTSLPWREAEASPDNADLFEWASQVDGSQQSQHKLLQASTARRSVLAMAKEEGDPAKDAPRGARVVRGSRADRAIRGPGRVPGRCWR